MRGIASSCAVAFALANIYLLFLTGPLVSPQHQLIFHLPGSATAVFGAVLIDLVVVFGLILAALRLVQRHPRAELLVWAALLLPIPIMILETVASFTGRPPSDWALWFAVFFLAAAGSFCLVRVRSLVPRFQRICPAIGTVLAFVSVSGLIVLCQLVWFGWKARNLNPRFDPPQQVALAQPRSGASPRIIWIVLDELSFKQVYGQRYPGLPLPNFDRLAAESTVFTHASAAAQYTRIAMPAMLTGLPLTRTSPTADGRRLLLHVQGVSGWAPLQPRDTVFGDAARYGFTTGVAGWYEPYCRLLPGVLGRCFWTYSDNIPGGLSGSASLGENAIQPLRKLVKDAFGVVGAGPGAPSEGRLDVKRHAADYRALLRAGDELLQDDATRLVLLHMPVPHPWGFYDRRTGTFPSHRTSYLDNLALADAYVGHVRALLEPRGGWDNDLVIIMGDHGWRTGAVWKQSGFWTEEEERASGGGEPEDAPALIVKLPGQHTPDRIDAPYEAVRTRALIDAAMAGQLETAQQLTQWVEQAPERRQPAPR